MNTDNGKGEPVAPSTSNGIETEGDRLRLLCEGMQVAIEYRNGRWGVANEAALRAELAVLGSLGGPAGVLDRAHGVCAALNACLIYPDEAGTLNKQLAALESRSPSRFYQTDFEQRIALTQACAWLNTEGAWRWLLWMMPKRLEPSLERTPWVVPGWYGWERNGIYWDMNENFAIWLDEAFWTQMARHPDVRFAQLAVASNPSAPPAALSELVDAEHPEIRELVALNPSTPAQALGRLAGTRNYYNWPETRICLRVLQNKNTPPALLKRVADAHLPALARDRDGTKHPDEVSFGSVTWAVIHPKMPRRGLTEVQRRIQSDTAERETVLAAALRHPNSAPKMLKRLANDRSHKVRAGIAMNPKASADLLARLAADRHRSVRAAVAGHPGALPDTLQALADDVTAHVRVAVARNEATPEPVLDQLTRDADPAVVVFAVLNPSLGSAAARAAQLRVLDELDEGRVVTICCREDTAADILRRAVDAIGDDNDFLYCFASHPNAPVDLLQPIIDTAVEEGDSYLLGEILSNPNLPSTERCQTADALRRLAPRDPRRTTSKSRKKQKARHRAARGEAGARTAEASSG